MAVSSDFSWMRVVLGWMFDALSIEESRAAIASTAERERLREQIDSVALAGGRLGRVPVGDYGDNLVVALLALRTKFSEAEAFEKVETNIAMRERRPRRGNEFRTQ